VSTVWFLVREVEPYYENTRVFSLLIIWFNLSDTMVQLLAPESPMPVDGTYGVSVSVLDGLATGIGQLISSVVEELPGGYRYSGSTFLPAFYQSDSVEHVLGNLATSLTNHIRQSGSSATKKWNS
jgi:hypothetical protein